MERAKMLIGADLLRVVRANRSIAGSALFLFHLPITEQIGGAAACAKFSLCLDAANYSDRAIRHLKFEAHRYWMTRFSSWSLTTAPPLSKFSSAPGPLRSR